MTIENVLVKTVTVVVDIIEAEGRLEGREYAQSIGKLQEFEQGLSDYVKQRDEYIKAGISGPLNTLECWVSNPKKEAINTGKSLGHIAYSIGLKLGELESAADLAEQSKIAESEKMYDKINSDISAFTKNINDRLSKMSGPEILGAITECATDFYITGKVINSSIKVFKHAKTHGCSPHDSFNILNAEGLMPISELHPACADFFINSPKAFSKMVASIDSAAVIADKIKQGLDLSVKEVRDFIKASPEYAKNLEQLEQIASKLKNTVVNKNLGLAESRLSVSKFLEQLEMAEKKWIEFRSSANDLTKIAKNTGIPKEILNEIKMHVFHEYHLLDKGRTLFDANIDMVEAWTRLINGKFFQSDIRLLLHEYTELSIMKQAQIITKTELAYRTAHNTANKIHNWEKYV